LKIIEFIYSLSEELEDRIRVSAMKEKGQVFKFVVQYEALLKGKWRPIVRYDTSHGFAHKDIIITQVKRINSRYISRTLI